MLSLLQKAIIKAPPTVTDSLKHSLAEMQHKVDSLEKVVIKTEIGTGFFSEALATNLSLFVAIIGLSGLIGWRYFQTILRNHKKDIDVKVNKSVTSLESTITEQYGTLNTDLQKTVHDVNRAMYANFMNDEYPLIAFDWGLSCAESAWVTYPEDVNKVELWLDAVEKHLKGISVGDPRLIKDLERYDEKFRKLEEIENDVIKEKLTIVKKEFYHLVYSKPEPPENIMENENPPL